MSAHEKAVFLSYAREDAAAARRIAEALRAANVEVWFDENELRGGDAWDAKIRSQIRECALFIPIVSAATNARSKGYFRREWKLAVDCTQDLAEHVAFLVPVVIDVTPENGAVVPQEFLRVQWTRLAGGLPTTDFVERVKRLLDPTSAMETGRPRPVQRGEGAASPPKPLPRRPSVAWLAAVAALVIGFLAWQWQRNPATEASPKTASTPATPKAPAAQPPLDFASAKSTLNPHRIAVLPLDNFSPDAKDEYLAGGMTEELTSTLSKISGLEVIARTSAEKAKKAARNLAEIGAELRAGTLLEGSVRKAGEQLRISVQLIDVATQRHLWAQDYSAEVKDLFKTQADVAERVAAALQIRLLGSETQRVRKEPTTNIVAYQLYLQGRFHWMKWSEEGATKARELFKQALAIDPNYALAYCGLADAWDAKLAPRALGRDIEKFVRKAVELDETLAEAHLSMSMYRFFFEWNWPAAEVEIKRALTLKPSLAVAHDVYATMLVYMGRFDEAIAAQKKAVNLDPVSAGMLTDLGWVHYIARKYEQAIEYGRKAIELDASIDNAHRMIGMAYAMQGKTTEALPHFEKARSIENSPATIGAVGWGYAMAGRRDEARQVIQELEMLSKSRYVAGAGLIHAALGETEQAFAQLEQTVADRDPWCVGYKVSPEWDSIRADPRFQKIIDKIGLHK